MCCPKLARRDGGGVIRASRDCPFCAGQGFVCIGVGRADVDACKVCAMALLEIGWQARPSEADVVHPGTGLRELVG